MSVYFGEMWMEKRSTYHVVAVQEPRFVQKHQKGLLVGGGLRQDALLFFLQVVLNFCLKFLVESLSEFECEKIFSSLRGEVSANSSQEPEAAEITVEESKLIGKSTEETNLAESE